MPHDLDDLPDEAIPLIAEDLRSHRTRLGLTSARAAKRAGMSWNRYRRLESGQVQRNKQTIAAMYLAAERLGLQAVRVCHLEPVDQYLQVGVGGDDSPTLFIDTLETSVAELKEQGHFLSPHIVLEFVAREGVGAIVDSRDPLDRMMVELWVTAIYTLCRNRACDYYVSATRSDPPDTEVLIDDRTDDAIAMERVEVTQHGKHSSDLTEVIGKKLRKRYQEGTVLLVLVEEAQFIPVADLYEFIRMNNPHRQRICVVGAAREAGTFKVVPWDEVTAPTPDEKAWMEITVDTKDRGRARCQYDGVVFKPPFANRLRRVFPIYVRSVILRR